MQAETHRVDAREGHAECDGQRKLYVQQARHARHECHRNKDRHQCQCCRDDGPSHFRHARGGEFLDVEVLSLSSLQLSHAVFDDDNRIVHNQSHGQDHAEQAQRIDRETERRHDREGADQRNGNRQQWNQSRSPALQEDEDHKENQADG